MKSSFLSSQWKSSGPDLAIINPYSGDVLEIIQQANAEEIETGIQKLRSAIPVAAKLSLYERHAILTKAAELLENKKESLAQTICLEAGKPITYAKAEVLRAISTFRLCAAWVFNHSGEVLDLGINESGKGKTGIVKFVPVGPILAISPFNFPLNLVAHKIAPAIASGNVFFLKPASKTPLTAILLAEILLEAGFPPECFCLGICSRTSANALISDARFALLSFTGSPEIGWKMKQDSGKKKVVLELGGDAAVIVDSTADLKKAAKACSIGAFAYAGQVCISVQRIFVHKSVKNEFLDYFIEEISALGVGNPLLDSTICGPIIDKSNLERLQLWIEDALSKGAGVITGNKLQANNVLAPTVLEKVSSDTTIASNEVFGPLVCLDAFETLEEAVNKVNQSRFGLQTGVFTALESTIRYCFENLEVGGVIINESPMFRIDSMPYGGIKDSGFGREGATYAIKDMLEPKLLVW